MTYDKVQVALNRHHYGQQKNIDTSINYSQEVEKISVAPVKQRRKSSAYESKLANIKEVTERKSSENSAIKCKELYDSQVHTENQQDTVGIEHEKVFGSEKELEDSVTQISIRKERETKNTFPKYSITEMKPFEDKMSSSVKSKRSSGSDTGSSDRVGKSGSSQINEDTEHSDVFEDGQNSVVSVPKLKLGEEYAYKRKSHKSSFTENGSTKGIGVGSPLSVYDNGTTKLPNIKCEHVVAGRELFITQKHNVTTNIQNDADKCMICEITEATAKYASVEANRLLLEIVYPHEFYDKFQRSGKRTRLSRSQRQLDTAKEQINICKPATVAPKSWRRERTSQSITTDRPDQPNTTRDTFRNKVRERSEYDISPEKKIKTDGENEVKKEIHLQCKAKNNALVVTDDSEGQKLVLKGLKGWIMKKDDMCKNKMHTEIKKSLYQVNSLGMNFSIPEYNTSLSDRKLQFTRTVTCITSPRPPETQQPSRKSVTQNISPRNHVTFLNPPRDVQSVPTRTINSLQRGYTHVPKLFSDTSTDDSFSDFRPPKSATNMDHKTAENEIHFHKGNMKVSLPPIGSDMKSRSFTFTHL